MNASCSARGSDSRAHAAAAGRTERGDGRKWQATVCVIKDEQNEGEEFEEMEEEM